MAGSSPSRNLMDLHPPLRYQPASHAAQRPYPFYTGPRRPSPEKRSTGLPAFLCATALALGVGAVVIVNSPKLRGPVQSLISAQKDLRVYTPSNNFNAKGPAASSPREVPLPELPESIWTAPPPAPVEVVIAPPAPSADLVPIKTAQIAWPAADLPPLVASLEQPAVPSAPTVELDWNPPFLARNYRGDTPMHRNWKTLAFLAATVVFVHQPVSPVVAQTTENPDLTKILDKLNTIQITLNGLKDVPSDIAYLKREYERLFNNVASQQTELLKTNKRIDDLELIAKLLKARVDNTSVGVADSRPVEELKSEIETLKRALAKLESVPPSSRLAMSPPSSSNLARVVLVNLYPQELLFVVNKRTQRVPPKTTVTLESIPSGSLTYEVISPTHGSASTNTVNVQPNETFTLTARE